MGLIRDHRNLLRRYPPPPNETRYHYPGELLEYGLVDRSFGDGHGGVLGDEECHVLDG